MERAGKAARAATDTADATNWRRDNSLLLGMFVFAFLEEWKQISQSVSSSCSRTRPAILDIRRKESFRENKSTLARRFLRPRTDIRIEVRKDDVVIDVSRYWILAAMSSSGSYKVQAGTLTPGPSARGHSRFEPSAATATISCASQVTSSRWSEPRLGRS